MSKLKLIAIDLDGTLLSDDGTISRENREAIYDAQNQGNIITICSGRSLHDTQKILLTAEIDCPIITGNGAIGFHSNKFIQRLVLPDCVINELLPVLEQKGYYYELYTNQGITLLENGKSRLENEILSMKESDLEFPVEWANNEINIQLRQHGISYMKHYQDINISELEIYKIFVLSFNKDYLKELENMLTGRQDLSLTTSGWHKLEIAHKEVSKGNALTYMANHLDIPMKDTVAIGDNLNDLAMFKVAGMSIAMGNGEEEVKKLSTYTTRNYNEDGVAYALRKYVLKQGNE